MVILNCLAARDAHRARAEPRRARKLRRSFSENGYIREFGFILNTRPVNTYLCTIMYKLNQVGSFQKVGHMLIWRLEPKLKTY